jgi:hypothetical protein
VLKKAIGLAVVCGTAVLVSACASRPVSVLKPLPDVGRVAVGTITIDYALRDPTEQTPELEAAMKTAMEQVKTCARGDQAMDLKIHVEHFHKRNIAASMLVGDSNSISGKVSFVPNGGGPAVGEYYVQELQTSGGVLGLAILSGAEETMSQRFAKHVCEKILVQTALR